MRLHRLVITGVGPFRDRQEIDFDELADSGLFLIDGAEPGDISPYERCIVLFDGRDDTALALARRRWSRFKGEGFEVSYWRQGAQRGWEKQA